MSSPKFAVFGAGGVGGYFAAVLARAGHWTAVVARGKHLEAIQYGGLQIQSPKGDFTVAPAQATDNPQQIGSVDAVILAVKAWQVRDAALAMRPMLAPDTKVLPLENGVEAPEQLEQILGREHALIGLCRISSFVVGPGQIRHAGLEPTVLLGEFDRSALSPNAQALANALAAAGVVVETPNDIRAALWEKLVFIAALSGADSVARATVGELRQCPPTRELLRQLMEEVAAVARSRGIQLAPDVVPRTLAFVDSIPAGGTASMQRDIADGKPSELEAIIGAVVRFGDANRVPTPAMHYVYASLLPQEQRVRNNVRAS
jgi:2-dehydropantoate 2-reductase